MKKLFIYGTRPDCIKMAPLMSLFQDKGDIIVNTGQHLNLPSDILSYFKIKDTHNLRLMTTNQTLEHFSSRCLLELSSVIKYESPDLVVVQGDTSTAAMGALAAAYNQVKIAHVEAGMRTNQKNNPFPEEINRTIVDSIVDYAFCPNLADCQNIKSPTANIFVTGNTAVDALNLISSNLSSLNPLGVPYILVTCHRRESHGEPLSRVVKALLLLAAQLHQKIVFIAHPNPNVQKVVSLLKHPNILIKDPLDYVDMLNHIKHADLIITDSGGLQEEAPSLGKHVVYLRNVTELPHLSTYVTLAGTEVNDIISSTMTCLSKKHSPFKQEKTSPTEKIAKILESL